MTGSASGSRDASGRPERLPARMVLDVGFALEGPVADLLRSELDHGVAVHVVLLRLEELAHTPSQGLAHYLPHRPDQEGIVLR